MPEATIQTATLDQVHAFLAQRYKHDRFEGRNNATWGNDYSRVVARSTLDELTERGVSLISQHESMTGNPVYFDAALNVLTGDEWRAIVKGEAGRDQQNRRDASRAISVSGGSPGESLTVPTHEAARKSIG